MADIDRLAGFLNEPYQKTRVIEAARLFGYPFTLSEAVEASGVPIHVAHRVLKRAVKSGTLTRTRMAKTFRNFRWGLSHFKTRRVYLYSFVEAE